MKRFILVLPLLLVSSVAFANADLQHLLTHPEAQPTRAQWVDAGAGDKGQNLIEVAFDKKANRYARMRAVSALSHFPEQKMKLAQLIQDKRVVDAEVRIQALTAYTFVAGAEALPLLESMSSDKQPELRAAAARNIVRISSPEADRLARAFLVRETEPWIKRSVVSALERKARRQ